MLWAAAAPAATTGTNRRSFREASSQTQAHESAGSVILVLARLHGLMALWHPFVLGDNTLRRMSLR